MKFTRLRIAGFKSFVEPTEFLIEPGLTGVVGPNGCGKSNLTEAIRWVMGESSSKNMRAGGMDDVIFAGTNTRPSRNSAEVLLSLDNAARTAPAGFNQHDQLDVSRRIERDGGSTYRVNGREVRARDVHLLFADASSGARSPAMVRQGQVAELIAAKPTSRRRLLEEAAGISGLHARRHETEIRLRAAEANLERVDDVLNALTVQLEGLRKQARQSARYRGLTTDIHAAEALLWHLRWTEAEAQVRDADTTLEAAAALAADRAEAQARTGAEQAIAAFELPGLRDADAKAAAALQHLALTRESLDAEERRAREKTAELDRRITQLTGDMARETALAADTDGALARLAAEEGELQAQSARAGTGEAEARERLARAETAVTASEAALSAATSAMAQWQARRAQAERAARDAAERIARLGGQLAAIAGEAAALQREMDAGEAVEPLRAAVDAAKAAGAEADTALEAAEAALAQAREAERRAQAPLAEADKAAQKLETEASTLRNLLARGVQGKWRPVLDQLRVAPGYEMALGAVLGDDLDASMDAGAPLRWAEVMAGDGDAALPAGAEPMLAVVEAPGVMTRRLRQIGIVPRADGPRLARLLMPGQRLVSVEGDVWRWDGFVAAAEAPAPAARKLAEKNRLAELDAATQAARARAAEAKRAFEEARATASRAAEAEQAARHAVKQAQAGLAAAHERLGAAERRTGQTVARLSALAEARIRLESNLEEARAVEADANAGLAGMADAGVLEREHTALRAQVAEDRSALAEARAAHQTLTREAELRARRIAAIAAEREQWLARRDTAAAHAARLDTRLVEARAEREALDGVPGLIREQRLSLLGAIAEAETARARAGDALALGETRLAQADRAAREAMQALSEAREAAARAEARLDAARERLADTGRQIREALDVEPAAVLSAFDVHVPDPAPALALLDAKVESLRRERDRLGPVNLRAEDEVIELSERRASLEAEKHDLEEAIRRLRGGISNLNREGRERLLDAFSKVDAHFRALFSTLFGGGTAELALIDADDPLEAGLDIVARPPGKKPQSLSLLSGGEQALTATALIFAVFLTNPAPLCVLDEVDAPLDDHNVERYCDLLDEMVRITATRFIVITHNPITMARMHRLFGVTMAERGVSQLVSVDLESAERLVDAA